MEVRIHLSERSVVHEGIDGSELRVPEALNEVCPSFQALHWIELQADNAEASTHRMGVALVA
jgi:hypothetical protein